MAIAKIKKLEIIGLQEDKNKILVLLQKLGLVELIDVSQTLIINDQEKQKLDTRESSLIKASYMGDEYINPITIEEAISFLVSFQEKSGFLQSIIRFKPLIYQQQLQDVIANFDYKGMLKRLSDLRNHMKILYQHKERLHQERQLLIPWHNLGIPLDHLHPTQNCGILLGLLPARDYSHWLDECKKEYVNLFCETINQDKSNTYLVIIYLQEYFEQLEALLKKHHFNFVNLSRHESTVKDRLFEINRELVVINGQIEDAKGKVKVLSKDLLQLKVVYDYLLNKEKVFTADNNLAKQQFTFCLSSWIKAKDATGLGKNISREFKDAAIFISEPLADEAVPIVLENKRLIQPFEFITSMYGMPKYNELDPTPFLAPFFFLYFGLCVSDVGYGLMLMAISWFALKKFNMGKQGENFFRLFLFCGLSTVIVGMLTGSWFGNLFDLLAESNKAFLPLKRFKDSVIILDPLQQPTRLLGIALSLGIVQVWFGNIVAAIGNIKNKRYWDILFDQATMLAFLFGLTGLGLIFLNLLNKNYLTLFKGAVIVGAITLLLTQGRSEKGLGGKLFYGAYNLYNCLSGYLSDILSYSRLWALGLVTSVMANTINLISMQFSQIFTEIIPFVNKIRIIKITASGLILVGIFVIGHSVSFLMNLLGAFVHPVRLQFVEFFSKFFKSGGRVFRPFKAETKYINIQ